MDKTDSISKLEKQVKSIYNQIRIICNQIQDIINYNSEEKIRSHRSFTLGLPWVWKVYEDSDFKIWETPYDHLDGVPSRRVFYKGKLVFSYPAVVDSNEPLKYFIRGEWENKLEEIVLESKKKFLTKKLS